MNVEYSVNPNCKLSIDVKDVKQAFSFLAYADDVFGTKRCGNCESPNLKFDHRTPKGYEYFSIKCKDCRHELKFGQQKENGRLFNKGWEAPYQGEDSGSRPTRDERDEQAESFYNQEPAHAGADSDIAF